MTLLPLRLRLSLGFRGGEDLAHATAIHFRCSHRPVNVGLDGLQLFLQSIKHTTEMMGLVVLLVMLSNVEDVLCGRCGWEI